ncbi:MAG: hypothetical protein STSR0009_22990 [Methanoregula sp.]
MYKHRQLLPSCPPAVLAIQQYPVVSFNVTPVQYAQVNGVTLGYREFGSGEPLLVVQGFGATWSTRLS